MNGKMRLLKATLLTLAGLGIAVSAYAVTADTATTHHHPTAQRGGFHGDGFMAALHKLNLTAEQQQSIHTLTDSARQQAKTTSANGSADFFALQNPGDPNYAQAVRNAQSAAANRIEQRSALDQQVYNLLTTEQKTQLPQVLSAMKAKAEQHRAERQQKHSQTTSN